MKLIRTGLIFIFFGLYFASCGNHPSDEKNLSESSEAASVREAYEDWVIENYGEEYTEEIQRLQDKSIQKDLQSHFTGDTDHILHKKHEQENSKNNHNYLKRKNIVTYIYVHT